MRWLTGGRHLHITKHTPKRPVPPRHTPTPKESTHTADSSTRTRSIYSTKKHTRAVSLVASRLSKRPESHLEASLLQEIVRRVLDASNGSASLFFGRLLSDPLRDGNFVVHAFQELTFIFWKNFAKLCPDFPQFSGHPKTH